MNISRSIIMKRFMNDPKLWMLAKALAVRKMKEVLSSSLARGNPSRPLFFMSLKPGMAPQPQRKDQCMERAGPKFVAPDLYFWKNNSDQFVSLPLNVLSFSEVIGLRNDTHIADLRCVASLDG